MSKSHQLAIWLMWLALPITALDYWLVWDQLPARMAVHFDMNWRANGWASREAALVLGVGVVAFMLLVFTSASYAVSMSPVPKFMPWVLLVFFYGVIAFVCAVNHWVVRYNLGERVNVKFQVIAVQHAIPALEKPGTENWELRTEN